MIVLSVATGGFFGSICRFYLSTKLQKHIIATWIANSSGAILLALIWKYYQAGYLPDFFWYIFGVGFCGAYTTFSTFSKELLELLLERRYKAGWWYLFFTVIPSIIAVYLILTFL